MDVPLMSHDESGEEMYSITSSKTVYTRSKSRPSSVMVSERTTDFRDLPRLSDSDERRPSKTYCPVTRWAVDYNNQNYVRSKCNKNKGLHRKIRGRPLDWLIEYDNSYFNRSKVNAPKGLHRRIPDLKRKYVPDNDDLADATGWEFDCGPEWDQVEQDVTYIPEGRIVARGCYRWYGVRRNDSDCDLSQEETRENLLNEEFEKQLKYGQEFLQADRPHMAEQIERRYSRGGYRFYETQRNTYDIKPDEIENAEYDPEWRRQHHINGFRYLDLEMCEDEEEFRNRYVPKGKPFRRTILNKVYELRRRVSNERHPRYGTRLSLVPGEGRKSIYEGIPDRFPFKSRKAPPIQDAFRRRRHSREKYDSDYDDEYPQELQSDYADRMRRMASERRRRSREDNEFGGSSRRSEVEEYVYRVGSMDKRESGKFPERGPKRSRSIDAQEAFDTWKDNTVNQKSEGTLHSEARPPRERKSDSKRAAPRQDKESGERRSMEKKYDRKDRALRGSKTRGEDLKDFGHSTGKPVYKGSDKRYDYTEKKSGKSKSISRSLQDLDELKEMNPGEYESVKKLPPHVQKRMKKIRENMERKMSQINEHQHKENDGRITLRKSLDSIDLMKHKGHPDDHGYKHEDEYEKYVTKNGSEVWVRKEETVSQLHHKNP